MMNPGLTLRVREPGLERRADSAKRRIYADYLGLKPLWRNPVPFVAADSRRTGGTVAIAPRGYGVDIRF
jgi:hypothetical protein